MLNTFPELITHSDLAPFILRLVLGLIAINLGYLKLTSERKRWETSFGELHMNTAVALVTLFGVLQIIGGVMLLVGVYTQIVALLFSVILLFELLVESIAETILIRNFTFYLLLFAIAFSLLFSGPGAFILDV